MASLAAGISAYTPMVQFFGDAGAVNTGPTEGTEPQQNCCIYDELRVGEYEHNPDRRYSCFASWGWRFLWASSLLVGLVSKGLVGRAWMTVRAALRIRWAGSTTVVKQAAACASNRRQN